MREKSRILIVDDSPQDIQLILSELRKDYQVNAATSADAALKMLRSDNPLPDLILLDVNMPGTNGYEACKIIKTDSILRDIDVIFLSANDRTEEIIQGLDAGAIDYVVKPYDPEVLQTKVRNALETSVKRTQLKQQAESANKMVSTVMAEYGGIGNVLNFYRTSFTVNSTNELAIETVKALQQEDLNVIVFIQAENIREAESSSGTPSMLELELLERLSNYNEPFVEKGQRCFIIHKNIVVLVKNMPVDEEKRGSLKDMVKIMLEGAVAKLQLFIQLNAASSARRNKLSSVILSAKTALHELREHQQHHKQRSMKIMDEMLQEVESAFFSLGLTDIQEEKLLGILTRTSEQTLNHVETGLKMDEKIEDIVRDLGEVAKEVAK